MRANLTLLLTAALLAAPSCSDSGGGGAGSVAPKGTLVVEATDAFLSYTQVEEALIDVTTITVRHEDTGGISGGFYTVYSGPPITMDLLNLRNGVVQPLGQVDLPIGFYDEVRLIFSSAQLKLVNGNEYSTAAGNLKLASQATSGLKVKIDPPIEIVSQVSSTLLLDFDLMKTFHPIPSNDPMNAATYQLMPVIRAANRTTTGDVSGVVTKDDGAGNQVGVEGADVYVLPPGETDPANAITSTATGAGGGYAVLALSPGSYDLLAQEGGLEGTQTAVQVAAGNVTIANIEIQ